MTEDRPADDLSPSRQPMSRPTDTLSTHVVTEREVDVTTSAIRLNRHGLPPSEGQPDQAFRRYRPPMTTSASSVIAAIEARRPGLTTAKLHLLLFFAQGHHLAHSDDPLFAEALYATERGVSLDDVHDETASTPTAEGQLNSIGYVVSRYGALSHADLRTLVQASTPWQLAMKSTSSPRIEWAWLRDWFRRPDETDDPDDERPNRAEVAEVEAYLASRGRR
jgi:uncharacterized phage-associated protein